MKFENKYLRNLAPYNVASHKIWEVDRDVRKEMLKLDWNESTIPPSPKVKEALQEFLEEGTFNLYPNTNNKVLLNLLANYCLLPMEYLQYFASSDALQEYLVRMYVSAGDPILILGPTYDNFRLTCETQGGRINYFNYNGNFTLDEDKFIEKIEELSPSLVYICNPNNPTGNLLEINFIERILKTFPDTIILIDEAYCEFSGRTVAPLVLKYPNLFISRTFSKAFGLANFRAGYLISDKSNIEQISKIRNAKNFTTFAQIAVIEALKDLDYMKNYVDEVILSRQHFSGEITKLPIITKVYDSHGNFVLVEFINSDVKMNVFKELSNHGIYVRNLIHSKMLLNCLRITIGTREQMKRVLAVFNSFSH